MYPKLKVRSQDQDFRYGGGSHPSFPGLKALFLADFSNSAKKESKPTTKKLDAEVPNSLNLGSITPLSTSKDDHDKGGEEDRRPHIRASSIPRPRAVLSSPDNDDMIGSKTKRRIEERTSRLKPHQSGQKCDATTKHSSGGRSKTGRQVSEEATDESDIRKTHRLGPKSKPKHSAAERLKSGREVPEEISNKSDTRENKRTVTTIMVKE